MEFERKLNCICYMASVHNYVLPRWLTARLRTPFLRGSTNCDRLSTKMALNVMIKEQEHQKWSKLTKLKRICESFMYYEVMTQIRQTEMFFFPNFMPLV